MKYLSKTILSTALLAASSTVFANSGVYVGFGVSTGSGEETYEVQGFGENTWDADQSQTQFIFGWETSKQRRFEMSLNSISLDGDDGITEEYSGFDLDWYYTIKSESIKPFFGFGLGFYTFEDTAELTIENEDISGFAFNLAGGVLLPVHENIELEVAYRYKNINWQDLDFGFVVVEPSSSLSSIALTGRIMF